MEKSSEDSSNNNNNRENQSENYLKHLNKFSHKISKPIRRTPPLDHHQQLLIQNQQQQQQQQQQQHQPPVYNINKSDFRDVVQKLTGSPAHDRFSTPPPIHPPKPPSSRLQRIRPPPLAHISTRPSPPLNNAIPPHSITTTTTTTTNNNNNSNGRLISPLSPLPPFPTVHVAAESPITAYMRCLRGSVSAAESESKRWKNPNSIPQQPHQGLLLSSPTSTMGPSQCLMPNSPLAYGRIPSPRSPYPLLSPSLLFSPSSAQGFPQFPPSLSPSWKDL